MPILWWLTKSTEYNWYHCHFHIPQFFSVPERGPGTYLSFRFLSILLCGQPRQARSTICKFSLSLSLFFFFFFFFFLLIEIRSGPLAKIMRSVCFSKSRRRLCISFSRMDSWWCIYHLFIRSNLNYDKISSRSPFPPSRFNSYTLFVYYSKFPFVLVTLKLPFFIIKMCCLISYGHYVLKNHPWNEFSFVKKSPVTKFCEYRGCFTLTIPFFTKT